MCCLMHARACQCLRNSARGVVWVLPVLVKDMVVSVCRTGVNLPRRCWSFESKKSIFICVRKEQPLPEKARSAPTTKLFPIQITRDHCNKLVRASHQTFRIRSILSLPKEMLKLILYRQRYAYCISWGRRDIKGFLRVYGESPWGF